MKVSVKSCVVKIINIHSMLPELKCNNNIRSNFTVAGIMEFVKSYVCRSLSSIKIGCPSVLMSILPPSAIERANLCRTLGSFLLRLASKIRWSSSSLLFTVGSYTLFACNPVHGNLAEWSPMTAVANSADRHGQSFGQRTAYMGTGTHVYSNVWVP
jgi:hypothetical protein